MEKFRIFSKTQKIHLLLILLFGLGTLAVQQDQLFQKTYQAEISKKEDDKAKNRREAERLYERSIHYNKRGNFVKGFELLDEAVRLDSLSHLGYRGWMKLYKLRDFEKALKDFNDLDAMTPGVVDAPWGEHIDLLRGQCYLGMKDFDAALERLNLCIDEVTTTNGESWVDVNAFLYQGICYLEMGNLSKAKTDFEKLLKYYEKSADGFYYLALTNFKSGSTKVVCSLLDQASIFYEKGYKHTDSYNEFLYEIYEADIEGLREKACK